MWTFQIVRRAHAKSVCSRWPISCASLPQWDSRPSGSKSCTSHEALLPQTTLDPRPNDVNVFFVVANGGMKTGQAQHARAYSSEYRII